MKPWITFPARSTRSTATPQRCALPRRKPPVAASDVGSAALAAPMPTQSTRAVSTGGVKRMGSLPICVPPNNEHHSERSVPTAVQCKLQIPIFCLCLFLDVVSGAGTVNWSYHRHLGEGVSRLADE